MGLLTVQKKNWSVLIHLHVQNFKENQIHKHVKNFFWNNKLLTIKGVLKPKVFLVLFSLFFSSLALAEPTFIAD